MTKKEFITLAVTVACSAISLSATADTALDQVSQLQVDYAMRFQAIQEEAKHLNADRPNDVAAFVGIDCKIEMGTQQIKFDLPQVRMKRKVWSFDVPEISWGRTHIGPIKLDLPQFSRKRLEVKLDVPEFSSKLVKWKIDVPQLYCKDPQIQLQRMGQKGQQLATEAAALSEQMRIELNRSQAQAISEQKALALKQFDDAKALLQKAADEVRQNGGDSTDLQKQLQKVESQRNEVGNLFAEALKQFM
jgi:hypothetical protein